MLDAVVLKRADRTALQITDEMVDGTPVLKTVAPNIVVLVAAPKRVVLGDLNTMPARWHEPPVVKVDLNLDHVAVITIAHAWNHKVAARVVKVH